VARSANLTDGQRLYCNCYISITPRLRILLSQTTNTSCKEFKMRLTAAIALSLSLLSYAAPYQCEPHPLLTLAPINLSSYYTYTTPAHQGPRLGVISFTLQNDQTDDTTECSGSSQMSFGWFYATQTFNCTSPSGETSFSFDSITKAVSLNTLWTCGG
jgi:hypothetical protein